MKNPQKKTKMSWQDVILLSQKTYILRNNKENGYYFYKKEIYSDVDDMQEKLAKYFPELEIKLTVKNKNGDEIVAIMCEGTIYDTLIKKLKGVEINEAKVHNKQQPTNRMLTANSAAAAPAATSAQAANFAAWNFSPAPQLAFMPPLHQVLAQTVPPLHGVAAAAQLPLSGQLTGVTFASDNTDPLATLTYPLSAWPVPK